MQTNRTQTLRLLEQGIISLFREKSAKLQCGSKDEFEDLELHHVLDNDPPWEFLPDTEATLVSGWRPPRVKTINGKRHWIIRVLNSTKGGEVSVQYLASETFQEVLLWFRRLERAHRSGVLKTEDLSDSWRFILPFGFSGRLSYFARYFQGEEEISSLVYIITEVLKGSARWRRPVHYLLDNITEEEKQILFKGQAGRKFFDKLKGLAR